VAYSVSMSMMDPNRKATVPPTPSAPKLGVTPSAIINIIPTIINARPA